MPSYLHPGVYVEEIPSGSKPIEGVGTSTAAFVSSAIKGPTGTAELIQSFDDYTTLYGDVASENDALGLAVQAFYLNGGKSAYVCRVVGDGALAASQTVNGEGNGGAATTNPVLSISASSEGTWGNDVYFKIDKKDQDALTFDLEIGHLEDNEFVTDEEFTGLSMRADDANFAVNKVNSESTLVTLAVGQDADLNEVGNQYTGATLTGGAVDGTNATLFSAGITGSMNLSFNLNGMGSEMITLVAADLSLAGDHDADAAIVAAAITTEVRALSIDAAHQAFTCTYDTSIDRFVCTSAKDDTLSSLEVYNGDLASLLRLDSTNYATYEGATITGTATKFSSPTSGLPNIAQPMTLTLEIDNHGDIEISVDVEDLDLVDDKTADGNTIARAIQDAVQAYEPNVAAYRDFQCDYAPSRITFTSGSSTSRESTISVTDGALAAFLRIQSGDTPTVTAGRQIEQGTARVIPEHDLGTATNGNGVKLAGGTDVAPTANDFTEFYNTVLRKVRDASIVINPGQYWAEDGSGNAILSASLAHCEKMKNRMLIIDPPLGKELDQGATVTQLALPSSTYSVLYYPWVEVANPFYNAETNPTASKTLNVAPSAFAAGLWAKTDGRRGVWKAPAGMGVGLVGAAGLQYIVEDGEQDQLNPLGVNCYRNMPGGGRVVWGARTLATKANPEWRYVPVRRTAIMIEQSIYEGIQWAVFEPNDHRLWSALRANIGNFMNGLFRVGAFQGEKASDAYFVRCGLGDTMTQGEIDAGQVVVVVGFAPLKPAEFVIVRIQQKVNQQ